MSYEAHTGNISANCTLETDNCMIPDHIPAQFNDRRRLFIDRLTRRCVTACGMAILLVMLLLFVWLIWVVVPLFSSPSVSRPTTVLLPGQAPAVALGMDSAQQWGWRIDKQGKGQFIPLDAQPPAAAFTLSKPVLSTETTANNDGILLNTADGFVVVQPDFSRHASDEPAWKFPLGDRPLSGRDPDALTTSVAQVEKNWWVAQASPTRITLMKYQPGQPGNAFTVAAEKVNHLQLSPDAKTLYSLAGNQLGVWQISERGVLLRETHTLPHTPRTMALLSGGSSLLIADDQGVTQWFDIAGENGPRLHEIRPFAEAGKHARLFTEAHRRVFAALNPEGELTLFASKQQGAQIHLSLGADIRHLAFSPSGDGLLVESAGRFRHFRIDNPWPDISWRSLWQKVWYEHYPGPDYVWQSTSANDEYQGKFSLVPMVVGTLKAAGLAMLFATPLALAAAMYTAWFMAPGLRRWVKPAIEMMGALPSVVIGLIAGLWLAPQLADRLTGLLLLPLMLTAAILLCSWGSGRLPARWQRRLCAEGREIWLLLPVMLATVLFCVVGIPWLEQIWVGHDLIRQLSDNYQQRNLLIAGVAMGFALVPLIFTLAEDAIFSVPASLGQGSLALGATPWQTLTRVVMPGASAGIFAALMIGFGRAVGETMIVLMATGNTPQTEGGLLQGVRSLAANVAIEMPEAAAGSAHYRILFLSALVLLIFTLVVNTLAELVRQRLRQRYGQQESV